MKKGLSFIKVIIVASLLIVAGTSCNKADTEIELSGDSVTATDSTEVGTSTEPTEVPTQATEIATKNSTEDDESAERQIVTDIYNDFWGRSEDERWDEPSTIDDVDKLSNRYLGAITSKADAEEKGEATLTELYGSNDNYYSYEGKFNEEYGVWVVKPNFPPARENPDGTMTATIGTRPIVVIRESDGKVLGTFSG